MQLSVKTEWNTGKNRKAAQIWNAVLSVCLIWWALSVLRLPWGSLSYGVLFDTGAAVLVYLCCVLAANVKNPWISRGLRFLPWILLFPWILAIWRGSMVWLNGALTLWNEQHRSAVGLFPVSADGLSVLALSLLAAVLVGKAAYWLTAKRNLPVCGLLGGLLALFQLLTGSFLPLAWALWLGSFLGLWLTDGQGLPTRQSLRIWIVFMAVLTGFSISGAGEELSGITAFRNGAKKAVHDLRYGEDPFPQGDLSQASRLHQGEEEQLTVQTGQEKSLYLKAFVGSEYEDGAWLPLSGSAYSGTYAGLLKWLKSQGFDPLNQTAEYYALCDQETAPESNSIHIRVDGGTRSYLYTPASTEQMSASYKEERDQAFSPTGLFGARNYTLTERSSSWPSELTVWADWVADPQTEEQNRYVQAENMYRNFVYDTYTETDEALEPLLKTMFWTDYDTENDGIYRAVEHVRDVLKEQTSYSEHPEENGTGGSSTLWEFLDGKQSGNAVLYASAVVEALRAKGIPARYVEGYYVSAEDIAASSDGSVSLTGADTHAWAEIYFDGIGWLPVDVTPGYYYDAVALRQMVSLPDSVKKTAALDEGSGGGEELSSEQDPVTKIRPGKAVLNMALLLAGLGTAAVLLVTVWFLIRRFLGAFRIRRNTHRYRKADADGKTELLKTWIYGTLAAQGIDACLGWKTEETDELLTERFPELEAGEYTRAVALLEKSDCGGITLERYELRVLETFLKKICRTDQSRKRTGFGRPAKNQGMAS